MPVTNAHIGRLEAIGIGKESTAGTKVSATYWYPKEDGGMKPVVKKAKDTSSYGRIEETFDSQTVMQMTETPLGGIVRDEVIGLLLLSTFGALTTTGSSVYDHAFTVANTNNHQTITTWGVNSVGAFSSAYSMVNDLTISCEAGDYVKFSTLLKGKKMVSETTPSYSFESDNEFLGKDVVVKFADTEAGLSGATATTLSNVEFTVNKNLLDYQALGDEDIDCFFNQQFNLTGNMEAVYGDDTLLDFVKNGTKKFMLISIINSDVTIGASDNPTLNFTFGKVSFEEWDKSTDNNGIVTQTIGFEAQFNNTDGFLAKADLKNTTSSY